MWTVEPFKAFRPKDYKERLMEILRIIERMLLNLQRERVVGRFRWDNLYFSDTHHEVYCAVEIFPRFSSQARPIKITIRFNPMALTLTDAEDFLETRAERYCERVRKILIDKSYGVDALLVITYD